MRAAFIALLASALLGGCKDDAPPPAPAPKPLSGKAKHEYSLHESANWGTFSNGTKSSDKEDSQPSPTSKAAKCPNFAAHTPTLLAMSSWIDKATHVKDPTRVDKLKEECLAKITELPKATCPPACDVTEAKSPWLREGEHSWVVIRDRGWEPGDEKNAQQRYAVKCAKHTFWKCKEKPKVDKPLSDPE